MLMIVEALMQLFRTTPARAAHEQIEPFMTQGPLYDAH